MQGFTGMLYAGAEWFMRFTVINLIWFVINLPILFVALSVYLNGYSTADAVYLLPLLLLIPVLFVPSTIALFSTVREWIIPKEQPSLLKTYFSHLKANYRQGLISGIGLQALWLVWLLDFYFFKEFSSMLVILFIVIGLGLFVYTINFFSLSAHYKMRSAALFKNAFFVTMGNPLMGLFIVVSNLALFYAGATEILFLFPFFIGTLSAYLSFLAFYRFSLKIEARAQMSS